MDIFSPLPGLSSTSSKYHKIRADTIYRVHYCVNPVCKKPPHPLFNYFCWECVSSAWLIQKNYKIYKSNKRLKRTKESWLRILLDIKSVPQFEINQRHPVLGTLARQDFAETFNLKLIRTRNSNFEFYALTENTAQETKELPFVQKAAFQVIQVNLLKWIYKRRNKIWQEAEMQSWGKTILNKYTQNDLGLEELKSFAKLNGATVSLNKHAMSPKTPANWKCKNGHTFYEQLESIKKRKHFCRMCGGDSFD